MEVPELGIESKPQLRPMPQLWQHWILKSLKWPGIEPIPQEQLSHHGDNARSLTFLNYLFLAISEQCSLKMYTQIWTTFISPILILSNTIPTLPQKKEKGNYPKQGIGSVI